MGDFIVDQFGWILGVVMVGLLVALGFMACEESKSDDRFMAECQADGRKRYECEAMLNGSKPQVVPMPVVIPVGR